MGVNTLLKVLEQLLHKIKANRRREMRNQYVTKYITTQPDEVKFIESATYNLYFIYIKSWFDRASNLFLKQRISP